MAFEKQKIFLMLYVVKVAWGRTSWQLELWRNEMSSHERKVLCPSLSDTMLIEAKVSFPTWEFE